MRIHVLALSVAATMACTGMGGWSRALADEAAPPAEAAPPDPTRGQWDAFLDPLRDAEDQYVVAPQKWIEDRPDSDLNTLHSLDPDHASAEFNFGQLSAARPSEGFVPGFGLRLDVGRAAKRIKADWDGDGLLDRGDTFEHNSFDAQEAYLTWTVPDDSPVLKGLTLKGGKFVTLLGAEVIEPWANYNLS
jgi:hypothetical protein